MFIEPTLGFRRFRSLSLVQDLNNLGGMNVTKILDGPDFCTVKPLRDSPNLIGKCSTMIIVAPALVLGESVLDLRSLWHTRTSSCHQCANTKEHPCKFETATGKVVALVDSAMYAARAQAPIKICCCLTTQPATSKVKAYGVSPAVRYTLYMQPAAHTARMLK